ncbi:glycosyltransferase family 4 protein [Winogradskyella endarachnes]|uniref:Glycosyltransferase n=1 Tax=Winogradskyella endarachnes TaxID=2681965 RepID=A0A6L6U5Z9_9FLAO|nr:glycosyltransferase family 4 protein [Winogradskyella endarachnes]MUU77645.1 glycosyltransferase [Winogradskyella endarachnes]
MHICFITNEFPKKGYAHGGIGTFVSTLSKGLVENGIKVSVVGKNYESKNEVELVNGIKVYRLFSKNVKGLGWLFNSRIIAKKLKEIHSETPIDIVEASDMGLAFLPKLTGVSYVIRMHGGHHFFAESEKRKVEVWKGIQEKLSYKKADGFIAVSDYVRNHTFKYLPLNNRPVEKINSPVNLNHFQPINKPYKPFKIVFVGTVCEKKGIRQLINAMLPILEAYPEASLDIYGRDWLFPNGDSYIEMLKTTELPKLGNKQNKVNFCGAIDYAEIPLKYAEAHVCVFPSHMETLGLVAPEAMCMGKPVIFTKLGPGPEVISHGITGLLCDPHNPLDIAKQIKWGFANSEAALQIGLKARESVLNNFNMDKIVTQNISFYRQFSKK